MGFFEKFKRNKEEIKVIHEVVEPIQEKQEFKKAEHSVIHQCELIMEMVKELEGIKTEYTAVTGYLNDIQLIENLPPVEKNEITEIAENIVQLNKVRSLSRNSSNKLSEFQFVQMKKEENEIPDIINRLKSNETYQATVKRDMHYLEGEKGEWAYRNKDLQRQQIFLRKGAIALLLVAIFSLIIVFVTGTILSFSSQLPATILIFLAAILGFFIFIKMQSNIYEIKKAEINRNHSITLLNKVKIKFVNITNAVDYTYEKFKVNSSYELTYLWEQYIEAVKEQDRFNRANEDIEYFTSKLVRTMQKYRVCDFGIWMHQPEALVNEKEMEVMKRNLGLQRQKLKDNMAYNRKQMQVARERIQVLIQGPEGQSKEISEIINSIDTLCSM